MSRPPVVPRSEPSMLGCPQFGVLRLFVCSCCRPFVCKVRRVLEWQPRKEFLVPCVCSLVTEREDSAVRGQLRKVFVLQRYPVCGTSCTDIANRSSIWRVAELCFDIAFVFQNCCCSCPVLFADAKLGQNRNQSFDLFLRRCCDKSHPGWHNMPLLLVISVLLVCRFGRHVCVWAPNTEIAR